jgi:hypothetical protein
LKSRSCHRHCYGAHCEWVGRDRSDCRSVGQNVGIGGRTCRGLAGGGDQRGYLYRILRRQRGGCGIETRRGNLARGCVAADHTSRGPSSRPVVQATRGGHELHRAPGYHRGKIWRNGNRRGMQGARGRKYKSERDQDGRFECAHWVEDSLIFMLVRTLSARPIATTGA